MLHLIYFYSSLRKNKHKIVKSEGLVCVCVCVRVCACVCRGGVR